jgi:hypothetical protein
VLPVRRLERAHFRAQAFDEMLDMHGAGARFTGDVGVEPVGSTIRAVDARETARAR